MSVKKERFSRIFIILVALCLCLVVAGVALMLIKEQKTAYGGASARARIIDAKYRDLYAQVLSTVIAPPAPIVTGGVIRVERTNDALLNPLPITGATPQMVASFTLYNDTSDTVILKKATFSVPAKSPLSSVTAQILRGDGKQIQFGTSAGVPSQPSVRDISFSSTSGLPLTPRSSTILKIIAKPSFKDSKLPTFIVFKSAEIFSQPVISVDGQGLVYGGEGSVPPPPATTTVSSAKPTIYLPGAQTIVNRDRAVVSDIGSIVWGATGDGVSIKTVKLYFSGKAVMPSTPSSTPVSAFSVDLIDASTAMAWASTSQVLCSPGSVGSCSVTFSPNALIPNGSRTKEILVRINSKLFTDTNLQDSLSVQMKAAGDITWSDGITSSINWNPVEMPMTVGNIYYP